MIARPIAALAAAVLTFAAALIGVSSAPAQAALTTTQIQWNLAGMYYYPFSAIDGQNGPQTQAAVRAYQADRCTARDGVVGTTTESLMVAQVKQIQAKVGATQDGWFGPTTKQKVAAWQSAHGLTADGAAGPSTMSAMGITRRLSCVATLVFDKNSADPSNSRLNFSIRRAGSLVKSYSWRAGSGKGTATNTIGRNDCVNDVGWLPNRTYPLELFTDYNGNEIDEWAVRLAGGGHVPCSAGTTTRFALFIHQDYSGGRYTTSGCIAITRTNVKLLHDTIRSYFGTSGSGGNPGFSLTVIS